MPNSVCASHTVMLVNDYKKNKEKYDELTRNVLLTSASSIYQIKLALGFTQIRISPRELGLENV
jgi:hypothetical protein